MENFPWGNFPRVGGISQGREFSGGNFLQREFSGEIFLEPFVEIFKKYNAKSSKAIDFHMDNAT